LLPKSYLSIPTVLLGRLAIDKGFQGKGIGKLLLIDSLKRCYDTSKSVGTFAVIVDPLDKEAERFYEKYGFINLPDSGKMFLSMKTIEELFE
jgi:GNAT superfamily N-acetyltransferase